MNKMQMAQRNLEVMLVNVHLNHGNLGEIEIENLAETAWVLADAMQAEADNREDKTRPKVFEEDPFKTLYPFIDWRNHGRGLYHFWAMDEDGRAFWHNREPKINGGKWDSYHKYKAPLFDYQGNWQDSLRKRPK